MKIFFFVLSLALIFVACDRGRDLSSGQEPPPEKRSSGRSLEAVLLEEPAQDFESAVALSNVPSPDDAEEAYEKARRAVIQNDQLGCIRALEEAPQTKRVVRLLITCYHGAGQRSKACRLAERYLQRYPQDQQFRDYMERRCRESLSQP